MRGDIDDALRRLVAQRADFCCEYCLLHEKDSYSPHQIDHILSRKRGGLSEADNLAYACIRCNAWKYLSKMNRVQHHLWRAVDQNGAVIDILVQPKRDRLAAERFFRKLLRSAAKAPRVIVTDKLRSYSAAKKNVLLQVGHGQSRYLNNRAENSHQPTRQRERRMKRFQSPEQAQRFLSVFEPINTHFRLRRHLISAARYRALRSQAIAIWIEVVGMATA